MNGDNNKISLLNQELRSKKLSRAERKEIMEEIYREKYKTDPRKPISQKGQAICNLILGLLIIVTEIVGKLTQGAERKSDFNGGDVYFIVALFIVAIVVVISSVRKSEPADELSKELMLKATSWAGTISIAALFLFGCVIHLRGNYRYPEPLTFGYDDVIILAMALAGVYLTAKNAIYLWLDRTPESDDEEE